MKILGHRGIRQEDNPKLPYQNTIEAINYALSNGADGVEIDVISSKDKKCFVIHDEDISAHSKFSSGNITQLDAKEIEEKHVGKDSKYKIPTLLSVLNLIKQKNKFINIEIKQEGIADLVYNDIIESGLEKENILVSSFNHHDLIKFREQDAEIKVGLLFGKESRKDRGFEQYILMLAERLKPIAYNMEKSLTYLAILESEDEKYFWTLNKEDVESFLVEGLQMYPNVNFITDYPEELIRRIGK